MNDTGFYIKQGFTEIPSIMYSKNKHCMTSITHHMLKLMFLRNLAMSDKIIVITFLSKCLTRDGDIFRFMFGR